MRASLRTNRYEYRMKSKLMILTHVAQQAMTTATTLVKPAMMTLALILAVFPVTAAMKMAERLGPINPVVIVAMTCRWL